MNQAGIEEGDLLLIEKRPYADSGEIVVALIEDEATVKVYKPGEDYVALVPHSSNPEHEPILVSEDFLLLGVVCKVFKHRHFAGTNGERESRRAYQRVRDELHRAEADLSVYRLFEPMGRMMGIGWYVTLVGERPPKDLERKLRRHLRRGERVELAREMVELLAARRREAKQLAPWVEGGLGRPFRVGYDRPEGGEDAPPERPGPRR